MIDANRFTQQLKDSLLEHFGPRLLYLGLQGSYARGEADEQSDIDMVAVLDLCTAKDLDDYRRIVKAIPGGDKACGFLCGKEELAHWPAYEIFELKQDTKDIAGSLTPLLPPVEREDIVTFVRIQTANLYHQLCHRRIYGEIDRNALLAAYKSTFYILQSYAYLQRGTYAQNKTELLGLLTGTDRQVLHWAIQLRAAPQGDYEELFELIFNWCRALLKRLG